MKIETIDLFGKTLFTRVSINEAVHMPTPMPDNEAGFVYVLKGKCINHTETEQLNIEARQAVLAKSGNSLFKTVAHNNSHEYAAVAIRFHKEILDKIYGSEAFPFYEKPAVSLSSNSVLINPSPLIDKYIDSIQHYFENNELLNDELLIQKLKELISILLNMENSKKIIEIMRNLFEKKTFQFREIVSAHLFSSISITELAQLTNRSLSSFKKEFKRVFNDTPQHYIIGKRLEKVAEVLLHSSDSLSNIAYDCQFKTLAHMSRVFKAQYGISPSAYQKNFSDK